MTGGRKGITEDEACMKEKEVMTRVRTRRGEGRREDEGGKASLRSLQRNCLAGGVVHPVDLAVWGLDLGVHEALEFRVLDAAIGIDLTNGHVAVPSTLARAVLLGLPVDVPERRKLHATRLVGHLLPPLDRDVLEAIEFLAGVVVLPEHVHHLMSLGAASEHSKTICLKSLAS